MTYPATAVNGFMISGFETPGPDSDFVYPRELKDRVLERWRDPTLRTKWRRRMFGGHKLFAENLVYMSNSFHQGAAMAKWLGDEHGWDVLMVVLKLVDNLQHKTWKYLDPRWSARNPTRREVAERCFGELDRAVGSLLNYAGEHGAAVMMVSDHGHGSLEGKVQPNLLLKQWGYLNLRGGGAQKATRGRYIWDRLRGRTKKLAPVDTIENELAVDHSTTRACVMHAGMAGFLYVNLEGRQPTGIVKPADYEALRDELKARFMGAECRVVDPQGNTVQLFAEVHKPEELYGCAREDQPWLPDLMLIPRESLAVVRKIRGVQPVRWLSYRRLEGTHRPDGVLIAMGPGVAQRTDIRAHIVDCAPTILAMLGLRIPDDMEGRVLTEMFGRPPTVETEQATKPDGATQGEEVFNPDDLQKVKDRLSDLGYLE
jgi:predicted AlkP superfamily phosphohydrolase/phosphomutase